LVKELRPEPTVEEPDTVPAVEAPMAEAPAVEEPDTVPAVEVPMAEAPAVASQDLSPGLEVTAPHLVVQAMEVRFLLLVPQGKNFTTHNTIFNKKIQILVKIQISVLFLW
jgi:hypothetical protein